MSEENQNSLQTQRLDVAVIEQDPKNILFKAYNRSTGAFIATASLRISTRLFGRVGLISYEVDQERQGRGFATELLRCVTDFAYSNLAIVNLYGIAPETNLAAQYVLRRTGFALNETLRPGELRFEAWNPQFKTAGV